MPPQLFLHSSFDLEARKCVDKSGTRNGTFSGAINLV
jgi:hypothetical protein